MDKMAIYDALRTTPIEARKTIGAGRLKGFTDINPMWRFKRLTEFFGACGVGWKYEVIYQDIIDGAGDEKKAFVNILLYYKTEDGWSEPIFGTGGASYISAEKNGLYTNDECFKMALTDAIGTACKALGMSADIYFDKDRTKYIPKGVDTDADDEDEDDALAPISEEEEARIKAVAKAKWGKDTPNKIQPILAKRGVPMVKDLRKIHVKDVLKEIADAD